MPVTSDTYWETTLHSFTFGALSSSEPANCIVDTGTSVLAGPTEHAEAIAELAGAVPLLGTVEYMLDCAAVDKLPTLHLTLSGVEFALRGADYVVKTSSFGQEACLFGLLGIDVPAPRGPLWILAGSGRLDAGQCPVGRAPRPSSDVTQTRYATDFQISVVSLLRPALSQAVALPLFDYADGAHAPHHPLARGGAIGNHRVAVRVH